VSSAEDKEDMKRQRLNICRKKQWHTFKVQGVKRKKRASLGLSIDVGSIYSVPSPSWTSMGRRSVTSNSFLKTKTDIWSHYGKKRQNIGDVLPWEDITDEAERLLAISKGSRNAAKEGHDDEELERSGTGWNRPIQWGHVGQRRPDSVVIDWANKVIYVLEFKRTLDQRRDYRERGESRAMVPHDTLRSLKKVTEDAEGENGGWKIKLIIFVGGTSGSVHAQTLNVNLKELQVIESKRNAIRKGLVYELLNAHDTVLCSYFAQRSGERNEWQNQGGVAEEVFQGLGKFEWGMKEDDKVEEERGTRGAMQIGEKVDVGIWCRKGSLGQWLPRTRSGEANDGHSPI
jgi:hypothetical protein